jgi:hypothetical protein
VESVTGKYLTMPLPASLYLTSQAGLLLSLRAGVNISLFMIVLPYIATVVLSGATAASRDLCIEKISIVLMILGTIIMFLPATAAFIIISKHHD